MASTTGVQPLNNYAGAANDAARVQLLLDTVPNPDVSPAQAGGVMSGGGGFLDEMSPGAAAQLRVELTALKAAVS